MKVTFKLMIPKQFDEPNICLLFISDEKYNMLKSALRCYELTIYVHKNFSYDYQIDNNPQQIVKEVNFQNGQSLVINDTYGSNEEKREICTLAIRFVLVCPLTWPLVPWIIGNIKELGNWNLENAKMMYGDGQKWHIRVEATQSFEYKYLVGRIQGTQLEWEKCENRVVDLTTLEKYVEIVETWDRVAPRNILTLKQNPSFITLKIHFETDDELFICGNISELGCWDINKALKCRRFHNYVWNASFKVDSRHLEYKYIVGRANYKLWETSQNRALEIQEQTHYDIVDYWNYPLASQSRVRDYVYECPLCNLDLQHDNSVLGPLCGHILCLDCYSRLPNYTKRCPMCRKEFHIIKN